MKVTRPFQGWLCDIAFSSMVSKNDRRKDFVGLHGETCWILLKDHFTGYLFGRCQKTKGTPLNWLQDLLNQYCLGNGCGLNCYMGNFTNTRSSVVCLRREVLKSILPVRTVQIRTDPSNLHNALWQKEFVLYSLN